MNRILNKWDSLAISLGIVIGIGIFRVPADVAKYLPSGGPLVLLAWVVGGLISFMGALCYAELSTTLPQTGGDYIFLRQAYGKLIAFLYAWTELIVIRTGSIAAISFLFADFACGLLNIDKSMSKPLAIIVVVALATLNLMGLDSGKRAQNAFTLLKVAALVLLICGGLFAGGNISRVIAMPLATPGLSALSAFALALIPILWTYGGWHENTFVAGETKNARQSLPFALLMTVLIVTSIYVLLNAIFLYAFPLKIIANSPLLAADMLSRQYGALGGKLLEVLVVLYSIGSINAMLITGSRIVYAASKDIAIFKVFSATSSRTMTPVGGVLLNALVACVFIMVGSFDRLLFFTGIVVWLFFALVVATIFVFRKQYTENDLQFRVPFYPWLPIFFILICVGLALNTFLVYPEQSSYGLALVAAGVPVFYISEHLLGKGSSLQKGNHG